MFSFHELARKVHPLTFLTMLFMWKNGHIFKFVVITQCDFIWSHRTLCNIKCYVVSQSHRWTDYVLNIVIRCFRQNLINLNNVFRRFVVFIINDCCLDMNHICLFAVSKPYLLDNLTETFSWHYKPIPFYMCMRIQWNNQIFLFNRMDTHSFQWKQQSGWNFSLIYTTHKFYWWICKMYFSLYLTIF